MTKLVASFEYYDWQTGTYITVNRSIARQQESIPAPRGQNSTGSSSPIKLVGPAIKQYVPKIANNQKRPDFPGEE